MTDVRNMREIMEAVDAWNLEEADVVDNSREARRKKIVGNFEEQLDELMEEYVEGAKTFGNAISPGIVKELEDVLRKSSFRYYDLNDYD